MERPLPFFVEQMAPAARHKMPRRPAHSTITSVCAQRRFRDEAMVYVLHGQMVAHPQYYRFPEHKAPPQYLHRKAAKEILGGETALAHCEEAGGRESCSCTLHPRSIAVDNWATTLLLGNLFGAVVHFHDCWMEGSHASSHGCPTICERRHLPPRRPLSSRLFSFDRMSC